MQAKKYVLQYNVKTGLLWEARFLVDIQLKVVVVPQKTATSLVYLQTTCISLCQQHLQRNSKITDDNDVNLKTAKQ